MRMNVSRSMKQAWGALLLFALAGAGTAFARQGATANAQGSRARGDAGNSAKFEVESKARYFLGETPAVRIVLTNTGRSPQRVKEAEYYLFSMELTGLFTSESVQQKKTGVYDGRWDLPKETPKPLPGQPHEWLEPKKREPKFVTLAPGESTTLGLDLSKTFGSVLGAGKYHLVIKSEDGQKAVKDFEVYFDDDRSVAALGRMLASADEGERNWAVINLAQYGRPKLITLLEDLAKTGDQKQRDFAGEMLTRLARGYYDPVKLRAEAKEQYFLGEAPIIAVSVFNGGSAPQTVTAAEYQKFSFELVKEPAAGASPETKTCVYDGARKNEKRTAGGAQRRPASVTLAEADSTTLNLNLFECFGSRLEVGRYELTVTAADGQPPLQGRKAVRKFEVYFDDAKSVPALAQVLKSDDAAGRQWAASVLVRHSRPQLVALLEELVKSGNPEQRKFAGRTLAELKAGNPGASTPPREE